jgi:hypothetical protein
MRYPNAPQTRHGLPLDTEKNKTVMARFIRATHAFLQKAKTWMTRIKRVMTKKGKNGDGV